jgi:hypothetical protein
MKHNPLGKNNFDRLAAAGLVAGANDDENLKAKTEARVQELTAVATKIAKVQAFLAELYVLDRNRQLARLKSASTKLHELRATKLPVGAKKHIEACLNEVNSLREGVYSTNSKLDKQTLALTASAKAHGEIKSMIESAQHRLEKIQADSSSESDLEEFYQRAADIIKKNETESTKVAPIKDKQFVIARVPVVPIDSGLSAQKLPELGFKSESLSGYAVIHNQLVIGINPKRIAGHDAGAAAKFAEFSKILKDSGVDPERITELQKALKSGQAELEKMTKEEGADPKKIAFLQDQIKLIDEKAMDLIKQAGVDPAEIQKLRQQLNRSHNALPAQVKAEAERLRHGLEKKLKVKLRFVSEKPFSFGSGVWWWIMPDRELDMLARASFGKRVSVSRWGFAFN